MTSLKVAMTVHDHKKMRLGPTWLGSEGISSNSAPGRRVFAWQLGSSPPVRNGSIVLPITREQDLHDAREARARAVFSGRVRGDQEELAATQKSVSADSTALETIRRDCSSKAAEWDARPGELL